jgi:trans-aconitate methyltransferase
MSTFTTIAPTYRQTSVLQQSASDQLFSMLALVRSDDVLDLGCGPGLLTREIRARTDGVVVGVDPSEGMIAQAQGQGATNITFLVSAAEDLAMPGQFDAIFCNSALQWFCDPARALTNCADALRPGGRIALQAPARTDYCPAFVRATAALAHDPRTRADFQRFRSPWFFCETAEEYADLVTCAGLAVQSAAIEAVTHRCSPEAAGASFESGAAAGYLNPAYYAGGLPAEYGAVARSIIADQFQLQADGTGLIDLTFFRVFVLARKP